jgi:hypothetical protein
MAGKRHEKAGARAQAMRMQKWQKAGQTSSLTELRSWARLFGQAAFTVKAGFFSQPHNCVGGDTL